MRLIPVLLTIAVSVLSFDSTVHAADKAQKPAKKKTWAAQGDLDQDFPFVTAAITAGAPAGNTANKGIALKLGNDAYACFDTDLLRWSAGWTGKYLNFTGVTFDGKHGDNPSVAGDLKFATRPVPGVAPEQGEFSDTRPEPFGPIDAKLAHWNGLYLNGDDVVLSYSALGMPVWEFPTSVAADGQVGFVRNFRIGPTRERFSLLLCEDEKATGEIKNGRVILARPDGTVTVAALVDAPMGVKLELNGESRISVSVPGYWSRAQTFKVVLWSGKRDDYPAFTKLLAGRPQIPDVIKGGPTRWPETVTTKGVLAFDKTPDGAYVVDQLTPPQASGREVEEEVNGQKVKRMDWGDNVWKRRIRPGGFDFFSDGKRAAISTWDGDIYIVSGIDDKLEKLKWKRFASGGFETLGLKIVNDVIYTSGRDQITRYHDFNNDGEADFYENFNNQITSSPGFHEFVFDLQTDAEGNFYTAKAGPVRGGGRGFGGDNFGSISAHAGAMVKISPDGKKFEVVATGFRAPNGMGIGPNGELTTGDNEGTWMPTCPLNWVEPGGFYGVEDLAHRKPIPAFKQPLCWMSKKDIDNSGGGQVWVTSDKWGPFSGELLHLSYGKSALYLVMKERIYGQMQGGVVKFPLKFTSSAMRGRFNPADGQLYICGLQGWQTSAAKLAGFDRVRYTGQPVYSVSQLEIRKGQVRLTFTQPLDREYAADPESYSVKRWNYDRSEKYGSPELSLADPTKEGRDDVEIQDAKLSADGRTVILEIADLKPVMQQSIQFDIKARDGTEIRQYIQHTINVVP